MKPSLRPRQLFALAAVLTREFAWVAPNVAAEMRGWRERAEAIPDVLLREDALVTLKRERLNPEGAALFTVLPARKDRGLLRLLVAYQVALDFLDTVSERPSESLASSVQMHRALTEALDPGGPVSDYYLLNPAHDDGGYLRSLVDACRTGCAALPGYLPVKAYATRAATRLAVQVLNHDSDARRRDRTLAEWARAEFPDTQDVEWFELTAAASSTLGLYALLALAADPDVGDREIAEVDAAYHPWICLACTLLDCFVDQLDDAQTGNHNYLDHYPSSLASAERLREVVARAVAESASLARGERHTVVTSAMVSMYLAKDVAREADLRPIADGIRQGAGPLVGVLLPVLRLMRAAHGVSAA